MDVNFKGILYKVMFDQYSNHNNALHLVDKADSSLVVTASAYGESDAGYNTVGIKDIEMVETLVKAGVIEPEYIIVDCADLDIKYYPLTDNGMKVGRKHLFNE